MEQAHWFYEDHIRPEKHETLKSYLLKDFVQILFESCSVLKPYKQQVSQILNKFRTYKSQVPVMGAIILDPEMEHCLLLRGVKSSASYGFPKGKVNQEEADVDCAVREVLEETSFDISALVSEENSIEVYEGNQRRKMFIAAGVDRQTLFAPQMRGEVGNYVWMPISELPTTYKAEGAGVVSVETPDGEKNSKFKFWAIWRFIKPLKAWIKKKKKEKKRKTPQQGTSVSIAPQEKVTTTTTTTLEEEEPQTAAVVEQPKTVEGRKVRSRAEGNQNGSPFPADFAFDRQAIMAQLMA